MTWLLCHPDLSGLRIYDPVPGAPTGLGSTLPDGVCRLRLGRLLAPGMTDCSVAIGHVNAYLGPVAVQSDDLGGDGCADCAWADCWHSVRPIAWGQSAVRLPSSAQHEPNRHQPCLERLLSLG